MSPSELFEIAVVMIMAVEELKKINADEEMRAFLEDCEKARSDELSTRNAAQREGLEEGLEKGLEKGRQEERLFLNQKLLSAGIDALSGLPEKPQTHEKDSFAVLTERLAKLSIELRPEIDEHSSGKIEEPRRIED
ncbi:MAG: hypothetical protein WA705_17135 [Candidatus Ozemobacteraceae bacterium]